jgi:hypothetical protein
MKTMRGVGLGNVLSMLVGLGFAAPVVHANDQGTQITWSRIVGLVTPEGIVGRPTQGDCVLGVDCIAGTPGPWTVTSGHARVDLDQGLLSFAVRGLVLAGDPSFTNLGTRGFIRKVKGTLVCNDTEPGTPEIVDTAAVRLTLRGNAAFSGPVALPPSCISEPDDIVFLIRIANAEPSHLVDRWNAFGAVRAITQAAID